jgi:Asp-tRNA(Asn)/Glu-tRNA(Gln) amidotransferase A subunit family amidase
MTIRAKLYAAIVLTILGPLATTAVALHGMGEMGDRFDEVQERARHESIALELKFAVTDMNGWQTAYGYDNGQSRPVFERSVETLREDLRRARATLTDPRERELLADLRRDFAEFMRLDQIAYAALREGDEQRVRDIFLGPEIARFSAMAEAADRLATYEAARAAATERAFDDARDDARKRLIAVALGAGLVIVLLLVTARDLVRTS